MALHQIKILKADFYRVIVSHGNGLAFEDLLKQVADSPDDEKRTVDVGGSPVRLMQATFTHGFWQGDMIRIRMDGIPIKARLSGEVEEIDLEDDEGI